MPTHPDEYQEHVLNAPDLCSNCMSIVRVERERPATGWRPAETFFSRNQATTSVEHVPAETVSESEQVFCECGVASAFDRYWTWRDVDRDRFRTLLKRLLRSLERKGLTIARQPAAAHALATYDEHPHVDHHGPYQEDHTGCIDAALADGLLAGLRIGSVRGADRSTA